MPEIGFILDIVLPFFLLVSAVAVLAARDLMISTIMLSIFSLLMAGQYLVLGAPDVAITEAAVGAGISTILLLLVLFLVGHGEKPEQSNKIIPFLVVAAVTSALIYATFHMPVLGDALAPANMHVAPYYLQNSGAEIGIPNVVTSILASYRGFDTFGETVVVFTAAMSVLLLLGKSKKEKSDD